MITSFEVHNFKSIKRLKMDLHPFLVLVGPNGSGKTNIVRALELFGELVRRGSTDPVRDQGYDQIIRREQRPARAGLAFSLGLAVPATALRMAHPRRPHDPSAVVKLELSLKLAGSINSEEVTVKSESLRVTNDRDTCSIVLTDGSTDVHLGDDAELHQFFFPFVRRIEHMRAPAQASVFDDRASLEAAIKQVFQHEEDTEKRVLRLLNWQRVIAPWTRYVRDTVEVTRIRLDSSSLRTESAMDSRARSGLIGPNGEGLAAAVEKLRGRGTEPSATFKSILDALRNVYPRIEDVDTQRIPTGRLILSFKEEGISDPLGQTNVSDGVLHALALLLAIEGRFGGEGLLAIEEPENAIHPWSARAIISRAQHVARRRQILMTTHSETVVNAVTDPACLSLVENTRRDGTIVTPALVKESALRAILSESGQKLGDVWLDGSIGGVPFSDSES